MAEQIGDHGGRQSAPGRRGDAPHPGGGNHLSVSSRRQHGSLVAFQVPDFSYYALARLFSGIGQTLFQAALLWQVYRLSGSTLQLGLIGLARFIPQLALTLLVGTVADSYDRRKVVLLAQITPFLCGLSLALLTHSGAISLPWLYALVFCIACSSAFDQPSRQALLPQLVPLEIFPQAVTAASTVGQFAFVGGPVVGGILIARSGVAAAYLTYAILIGAAAIALFMVRPKFASTSRRRITVGAVREGLAFLRHNQVALGAMTLDMFGVIFGGAVALLPVYATKILHVGAGGYGILTSALGIGSLAMSVLLLFLPPIKRTGATLLCAVTSFGLMTMLFGISHNFVLSLIAYALTGASDQVSVIQRQAAIQLTTPDELRGRVSAVNALFIGASGQVGGIESGLVAAATNAVFSVVSGGAACIGVAAIVAATLPDLRHYRIGTQDQIIARAQAAAGVTPRPAGEPEELAGEAASAG